MASREGFFAWLKENNVPLAVGFAALALILFAFRLNYQAMGAEKVIGAFVTVAFTALSGAASIIATLAVILAPKKKWGEAVDFRIYVGTGALIGAAAAGYQLYRALAG